MKEFQIELKGFQTAFLQSSPLSTEEIILLYGPFILNANRQNVIFSNRLTAFCLCSFRSFFPHCAWHDFFFSLGNRMWLNISAGQCYTQKHKKKPVG